MPWPSPNVSCPSSTAASHGPLVPRCEALFAPIKTEPAVAPNREPPLVPIEPRLSVPAPERPSPNCTKRSPTSRRRVKYYLAPKPKLAPAEESSIDTKKRKRSILIDLYLHHPPPEPGPTPKLTHDEKEWVYREHWLFDGWLFRHIEAIEMQEQLEQQFAEEAKGAHARRAQQDQAS